MQRLPYQLGFWSALLGFLTFLLFSVCFVMIFATSPLFFWTDLADYVAYLQANNPFWANLARFSMLLFGPLFVIMVNSVHEVTAVEKKLLTRNGLSLGLIFAALISIHYFVQLTAVRLSIQAGDLAGLEQVVQANPLSAVSAINMLGFTLFLGLSSLFLGMVFGGGGLERVIRIAFLANGVFCLVGGVSYGLQLNLLLFFTINLGMGGALAVATLALAIWFKRQ